MSIKRRDFTFTWDQHCSTLLSILTSFLENEKLVDVTLAAEGRLIQVHRLVLVASSPYFEEMLQMHPKKGAVIFLKDVQFSVLVALVEFMYGGSVTIGEEQLVSFIHTANILKIKGLAVDGNWMGEELDQQQQKDLVTRTESVTTDPESARTGEVESGCCYCCCSCSSSAIIPSPSPTDTKQETITHDNVLPFRDDRQLTAAAVNNNDLQQQQNQPTTLTSLDENIVMTSDDEKAPSSQNMSSADDLRQLQTSSSTETQQHQEEEVVLMNEEKAETNEVIKNGQELDVQQQHPELTTPTKDFTAVSSHGSECEEKIERCLNEGYVSTTSFEDTESETNLVSFAKTTTSSDFGSNVVVSSSSVKTETVTDTAKAESIQYGELPQAATPETRPADTVTELINFIASVVSPVEQSPPEAETTDHFDSEANRDQSKESSIALVLPLSEPQTTNGGSVRKRIKSNKKTRVGGEKQQSSSDTSCNSKKSRKRTREQVAVEEKEEEEGCMPEGNDKAITDADLMLKPFVCPNSECGRRYKYDNGLKSHLRECGVEPQFQCPLCTSRFKRPDHLKRHKLRIHPDPFTSTGSATTTAIPGSKGTCKEVEDNADSYATDENEERVPREKIDVALAHQDYVQHRQVDKILCRRLAIPRSTAATEVVDGMALSPNIRDPLTPSTDDNSTAVTMATFCDYEYLVLWKRGTKSDASLVGEEDNSTWEPYDTLVNVKSYRKKLDKFHRTNDINSKSSNDASDATIDALPPTAKRRSCSSNRVAKRNPKLN